MNVVFNGTEQSFESLDEFAVALDRFDLEPEFELWIISRKDGPSICMLRNGDHAWLMHLQFEGDKGVVTEGDPNRGGTWPYTLANGQLDEYPLSWCITIEQCFDALTYFFVNDGARYTVIPWRDA
jgi:hypothetical protein